MMAGFLSGTETVSDHLEISSAEFLSFDANVIVPVCKGSSVRRLHAAHGSYIAEIAEAYALRANV